jgi:hypothetical protein
VDKKKKIKIKVQKNSLMEKHIIQIMMLKMKKRKFLKIFGL